MNSKTQTHLVATLRAPKVAALFCGGGDGEAVAPSDFWKSFNGIEFLYRNLSRVVGVEDGGRVLDGIKAVWRFLRRMAARLGEWHIEAATPSWGCCFYMPSRNKEASILGIQIRRITGAKNAHHFTKQRIIPHQHWIFKKGE